MKRPAHDKEVAPPPVLPAHGILIESHHRRPGSHRDLHTHRHDSLLYVTAGRGRCHLTSGARDLGPDCAVFLPRGRAHQLTDLPGRPMVVFAVYFDRTLGALPDELTAPLLRDVLYLQTPAHRTGRIRRYLRQMLHEQDHQPPQFAPAMQHCLTGILVELHRELRGSGASSADGSTDSLARVQAVADFVQRHYYEPQNLPQAAKTARLSQRRFSSLFRQHTGLSFTQFVNRARVERARELLLTTEMPVAAIAFEVGFEELSSFYRAFRRQTRKSPSKLRQDGI